MGVIVGYAFNGLPTYTDSDVDFMYETESAQIWEEQNKVSNESKYLKAAGFIEKAVEELGKAVEALVEAEKASDGLKLADKVAFFARDFEDRQVDLKYMVKKALRGEEA